MENYLNKNTLNLLKNTIGEKSITYLNKSKIIYSSLVHRQKENNNNKDKNKNNINKNLNPNFDLNFNTKIILKNFKNPFIEDWKIYLILRAHSDTQITSRNNIISEKDLNTYNDFDFLGDIELEKYFYKIKNKNKNLPNEEFILNKENLNFQRNFFIFSNKINIEDLLNLKIFSLRSYKKYIIKNAQLNQEINFYGKEKFEKFCEENKIFLIEKKFVDLREAIFYCKKNEVFLNRFGEKIILEVGVNAMKGFFNSCRNNISDYYDHKNDLFDIDLYSPIDFFLLSVYNGEIDEKNLGEDFTSFDEIENSGLILINVSNEIKSEKGCLRFYTFVNKRVIEMKI
jgi:hypothetical protein